MFPGSGLAELGDLVLDDAAVEEVNGAVGVRGVAGVVRDHADGRPGAVQRLPYPWPTIRFNRKPESIFDYREEDIELINYQHHPAIKAEVSV